MTNSISRGRQAPQLPETLSIAIRERLAGHGVHNIEQWRQLGPKRRALFGITAAMVRKIDEVGKAGLK